MALLQLSNISKIYRIGTETIHALRTITLNINKNEYVALMGPSGSGKSTLMNILGCLDSPTEGSYILNGQDVSKMPDVDQAYCGGKCGASPGICRHSKKATH